MSPETLAKVNDLRQRILRKRELEANGQLVPPELDYTIDDLREHLRLVREDRGVVTTTASKAANVSLPDDLNDLFT